MKTLLKTTIFLILLGSTEVLWAQEADNTYPESKVKTRPIRLGLKLGFPNLVGGNFEYVTPLLRNKLAVNLDYSQLLSPALLSNARNKLAENLDYSQLNNDLISETFMEQQEDENTDFKFTYFEGGINYYIFKPGKGLYAGLSYGALKFKFTEYNLKAQTGTNTSGVGTLEFERNSLTVKLGAKLGGLFYFRPEIGYAFNEFPESVTAEVKFDDGSKESQTFYLKDFIDTEGFPQKYIFEGFVANIGIGFSF